MGHFWDLKYRYRGICKIRENSRNPLATPREEFVQKKSDSEWKTCDVSDSDKQEKWRHSERGLPRHSA